MQAVFSQAGNRVLPAQKQRAARIASVRPQTFVRTQTSRRARLSTQIMSAMKALEAGTSLKGNSAFDSAVPGSEGKKLALADLIGKQALVAFFYPKAGTSGCTVEAAQFREHQKEFEELGAQIVGISGDSPKDLTMFQQAQRLTYPLLADQSGDLRKAFGIEPMTRVTFVVDKSGELIFVHQPPKGSDVKEHITKSLEALRNKGGSASGGGQANDASKAGQNAPSAGSLESLKNLPDDANQSYSGAETL